MKSPANTSRRARKVYIEGSLRTRKWQDKQGNDRYTTEIIANEMQMLDSRGGGMGGGGGGGGDDGGGGGGGGTRQQQQPADDFDQGGPPPGGDKGATRAAASSTTTFRSNSVRTGRPRRLLSP